MSLRYLINIGFQPHHFKIGDYGPGLVLLESLSIAADMISKSTYWKGCDLAARAGGIIRGYNGTMIPGFGRFISWLNLGQPATWVNENSCRRLLPPAKRAFESGESDTAARVQIDCAVHESAERSHCQHYLLWTSQMQITFRRLDLLYRTWTAYGVLYLSW